MPAQKKQNAVENTITVLLGKIKTHSGLWVTQPSIVSAPSAIKPSPINPG
ncbi:hypothetical protein [Undibacterium sp. Ji49W]